MKNDAAMLKNFVAMGPSTNKPLERATKMKFIQRKVCHTVGILASPNCSRDHYKSLVSDELKTKILLLIAQCKTGKWLLAIRVDETSDDREQYIVHTILRS